MVKKILIYSSIAFAAAIVVAWIASGAPSAIAERKDAYPNPLKSFITGATTTFPLPRYPIPYVDVPTVDDMPGYAEIRANPRASVGASVVDDLAALEQRYDALRKQINSAKDLGDPSPLFGAVLVTPYYTDPKADNPQKEYLRLEALFTNSAPVNITGWTLQSMVSGVRTYIPKGSRMFRMGEISAQSDIYLDPGATAIVASGISPVGTSFRENMCTGYLDQFQPFTPALSDNCPAPDELLPRNADTYGEYGSSCTDFLETLPRCAYYTGVFPSTVLPACQSFVRSEITYNGCADSSRWRPSFLGSEWRIFLGASSELWHNDHDIIRLLDAQDRTVDVWSY